ncbi:MAG: tetratricopeptide repeat protein [Hyphomicrobiales bacterium]
MADNDQERRLAAILAADVVGYSRLMGEDEAGTLTAVRKLRTELIEPRITEHRGRLFKAMGDGFLAEFPSVVNAVACAAAIQKAVAASNAERAHDRQMTFRIGVHLGDVIAEGGDIFGDGVNVAARIEALAEPGGLVISAMVHDNIGSRLDLGFEDIGEQTLKNIAKPIRVYRLAAAPQSKGFARQPETSKPSIAVLPFDNMSADPEQIYFSDGITEDIITNLSKYRELLVIARNSAFQFRGKGNDVRDIGHKLGVQYIVQGSVRRAGGQIRVTAQLIEAETSTHVWAERYDRELKDIFAIQDEITQMVTSRVSRQLRESIIHRARNRPTKNLSAYEMFLKAERLRGRYDMHVLSGEFALRAVELDPDFAAARAILSISTVNKFFFDDDKAHLVRGLKLAKEAIALDSSEPLAHAAAGLSLMHLRRYREARSHLDESLSLNPNDTLTKGLLAFLNGYTRRYDEALYEIDEALRRDPYAADWFWDGKGTILMASGRPREALASFEKMKYVPPWVLANHVVCHVELENFSEAADVYRQLKNDHGRWFQASLLSNPAIIFSSFEYQDDIDRFVSALRRAAELTEEADKS